MHFEILVEDQSGKIVLDLLLPKLVHGDGSHTFRVHPYKGIGRIPRGMKPGQEPNKRILLDQFPRILRGYGASLRHMEAIVIVVVDLDDRKCTSFKQEILTIANRCKPSPRLLIRIAIEEIEAWLLGDRSAVLAAYPRAKMKALTDYEQDSICATWERLADAIHPGGAEDLRAKGWPAPGQAKCEWARRIAPHMDVDVNQSPSFAAFRDGLRRFL
jgi:Domain of unknown function (DUF4276)